jgi:O-antigen/teichoic acid export membrane protein
MATVAGVTWAATAAVWQKQYPLLPIAAAMFVFGNLLREYLRSFLFSEFNVRTALVVDAIYVLLIGAGLSGVWIRSGTLELPLIFLVMAIANVCVCSPVVLSRIDLFSLKRGQLRRPYAKIWKEQSRWALLGAACAELIGRAHVFVIGSFYGAAAVGVLQAGEMLLRPLGLVAQAWERIAQPRFAGLSAAGRSGALRSLMHMSLLGMAAICGLYVAVLWGAWPLLQSEVFRGAYHNISFVLVLWSVTAIVAAISHVYGVALQGLARFRELSVTSVAGAFVSLSLLMLVVSSTSYEWSILAIGAGRLVDFALMQMILRNLLGTPTRETSATAA